MSIEALEAKVIEWAYDRGIFAGSTDHTRWEKLMEELGEFTDAAWPDEAERNMEDVKLEAGDVLVTLINILHPYNLDLETCLAAAYNKIKNRTGQMVNGTYVKSEDLP